ncbi:hypothetical protein [Allosphingosinicella sp.]|uniref:hypothetical protein n=1 Tax=Allosphingosinicella sp. TaxID=2823234 RepID=UPI003783F279
MVLTAGAAQFGGQAGSSVQQAVTVLAQCHGVVSSARAGNRTIAAETIVAETLAACREAEDRVRQSLTAQYGAEMAATQIARVREMATQRMMQAIAEARGAPFVPHEGDEAQVWRRCLEARSGERARGSDSVEQIVPAVRNDCAAEERALKTQLTRTQGEAGADATIAELQADDTVRRRVVGLRAMRAANLSE